MEEEGGGRSTGFFTGSAEAMERSTGDGQRSLPIADQQRLEDFYDVPRCVQWIQQLHFQRVALQFPDCMLADATSVAITIGKTCGGAELFILADTSYGACCVDEVAAAHVSADAIIHFGHSCLSPANRLPVLFVFGKKPLDSEDAERQFRELAPETDTKIILFYDVVYEHAMEDLFEKLRPFYSNVVLSTLNLKPSGLPSEARVGCCQCSGKDGCSKAKESDDDDDCGTTVKLGRKIQISSGGIDQYHAFYVGGEGPCLLNLMMTFNRCPFYSYDPETKRGRKESLSVNKLLMKRYYMIEQAKDAGIVGILVGTLGVADYRSIIDQQKKMIRDAGKKVYTLVVGKINVAKLANFPEIDIFVLIACPENSLLDSKEYFKPVVTPFEMEIACNSARNWTGDYVTDFRQLLPGALSHVESLANNEVEMSLISGKMRTTQLGDENLETDDRGILVKRDEMAVSQLHAHAAGQFLHDRSWKGLEIQTGQHDVTKATEGRHGIASGYENEGQT